LAFLLTHSLYVLPFPPFIGFLACLSLFVCVSVSFWMTSALASEVAGCYKCIIIEIKILGSPTGSKNNSGIMKHTIKAFFETNIVTPRRSYLEL